MLYSTMKCLRSLFARSRRGLGAGGLDLVIEWSAGEWRSQLARFAAGETTELAELLEQLEHRTRDGEQLAIGVTSLAPTDRHALFQALCWSGCEAVEVTYLDERRLDQALRFMPYMSRIANTAIGSR